MMKSNRKKGIANLVTSLIYKVFTIAIGFIIPKLFITTYGSEINGLQSSVNQIFTYISLIECGVGAAALQSLYAPIMIDDRRKINAFLSATSRFYNYIGVIYFVLLSLIGAGYALLIRVSGHSFYFVFFYIILSGALSGINFFYLSKLKIFLHAKGDEYVINMLAMLTFIATSCMKIALIKFGVSILILQSCYLLVNLMITLIYYGIAKRKYSWLSFREKPDFSCIEQKYSVLVHRVSSLIFQNIDIVLLTFICGLKIVSIYSLYKMVVNNVTSFVASIGDSFHFIFGQKFNSCEENGSSRYCLVIDTFNVYYSAISFAFFSAMAILIIPFMKLYTSKMDQSYIYAALPLLYISIELLTVGREAMMRTIEVAGHFRKTQWRAVVESVINLLCSLAAIFICKHIWGPIGGLYGTLIGTIVAMLYRTIDINLYANWRILNRSCMQSFKIMALNIFTILFAVLVLRPFIGDCDTYFSFLLACLWTTPVLILFNIALQSVFNRREAGVVLGLIRHGSALNKW